MENGLMNGNISGLKSRDDYRTYRNYIKFYLYDIAVNFSLALRKTGQQYVIVDYGDGVIETVLNVSNVISIVHTYSAPYMNRTVFVYVPNGVDSITAFNARDMSIFVGGQWQSAVEYCSFNLDSAYNLNYAQDTMWGMYKPITWMRNNKKLTEYYMIGGNGTNTGKRRAATLPPLSIFANKPLTIFQIFDYNNINGDIRELNTMKTISQFYISYCFSLTGEIPSIDENTSLTYFRIYFCTNITGVIPPFNVSNTNLVDYRVQGNSLTGDLPTLTNVPNIVAFVAGTNQITGHTAGVMPVKLTTYNVNINQLTATAVNQILAEFVVNVATRAKCAINLAGVGNAAPTGQGLLDKATLLANGHTVTTN